MRHTRHAPLTQYDLAMDEVGLAILRLADAMRAGDPVAIELECAEARWAHRSLVELYPRLQLDSAQRDSLLGELALLRSRLEECEGEPPHRVTVVGGRP
jgi:hypothetical protein